MPTNGPSLNETAQQAAQDLTRFVLGAGDGTPSEQESLEHLKELLSGTPGLARAIREKLRAENTFDVLPENVQALLQPSPFHQTGSHQDGLIHAVTTVRIRGGAEQGILTALLEQPWTWWKHGKVRLWRRTEAGGAVFILNPIYPTLPTKIGIELFPPARLDEATASGHVISKTTCNLRFSENFEGPGRYEIIVIPGGCVLRSVWSGVARRGLPRLMPLRLLLSLHLRSERGENLFPFPRGTGFAGLLPDAAD